MCKRKSLEIKHGCTRMVFLIGNYAIKIPQFKYTWKVFLNGILCNLQEIEFSKLNDIRLCPIKFYIMGGWLLVMPRCNIISELDFANLDHSIFWPESYDLNNYIVPVANKNDSFGYFENRIVAIDYGS